MDAIIADHQHTDRFAPARSSGKLTDRGFVNNFYFRQKLTNQGTSFNVDFENSRISTTNPFTFVHPLDQYAGCCSVSRNRCSEVEPSIVNGRSFSSHKSRSMPPTLIWKSAL